MIDLTTFASSHLLGTETQYAIFPIFPVLAAGLVSIGESILLGYLGKLLINKINKKTRHILILGSKGSGKTILWHQLQGLPIPNNPDSTSQEQINSFEIKTEHGTRTVSQTKDLGGDRLWVRCYEEIIKEDGTFIYYLVDLMRLEETKLEVLSRISIISKIIKDKNLKNCGLKILATNHKQYKLSSDISAIEYVKRIIDPKRIKDLHIKIDEYVLPIELTNPAEVQAIKDEITSN